jgi:hypothetical protein
VATAIAAASAGSVNRAALTYRDLVTSFVSVIRWLTRAVTIFALCCAIGLQWFALQSIAWTAMIVDNAKHVSLCHAIAKTLDGAHPCSLCRIVSKAKTAEKKSDLHILTPKIDIICTKLAITLSSPFSSFDYATTNFRVSNIGPSPPVPPPRSFQG